MGTKTSTKACPQACTKTSTKASTKTSTKTRNRSDGLDLQYRKHCQDRLGEGIQLRQRIRCQSDHYRVPVNRASTWNPISPSLLELPSSPPRARSSVNNDNLRGRTAVFALVIPCVMSIWYRRINF